MKYALMILALGTQLAIANSLDNRSNVGDVIRIQKDLAGLSTEGSKTLVKSGSSAQIMGVNLVQDCTLVTLKIQENEYRSSLIQVRSDALGASVTIFGIKPSIPLVDTGVGAYACPL